MKPTPFRDITKLVLFTAHGKVVLDIAPTMRTVVHNGRTYHRLPAHAGARGTLPDGTEVGCYLCSHYAREKPEREAAHES